VRRVTPARHRARRRPQAVVVATTVPVVQPVSPAAPGLAFTGLDLIPIAGLGLGLMLLGSVMVSLAGQRRRRRRRQAA
jgi:hypothetical protein